MPGVNWAAALLSGTQAMAHRRIPARVSCIFMSSETETSVSDSRAEEARDSSASVGVTTGEFRMTGSSGCRSGGVANPHVIDVFGIDDKTGEILLVMKEPRPWDGGDAQLHQ